MKTYAKESVITEKEILKKITCDHCNKEILLGLECEIDVTTDCPDGCCYEYLSKDYCSQECFFFIVHTITSSINSHADTTIEGKPIHFWKNLISRNIEVEKVRLSIEAAEIMGEFSDMIQEFRDETYDICKKFENTSQKDPINDPVMRSLYYKCMAINQKSAELKKKQTAILKKIGDKKYDL